MREALWLVKNGVTEDLAFQLNDVYRTAWCIIFRELEGHQFDFNTMNFKELS